MKSRVSFPRHSLLLIKLNEGADPAKRASERIITMTCSLCGAASMPAGKSMHLGERVYYSSILNAQEAAEITGRKSHSILAWCKETTGEAANPALGH